MKLRSFVIRMASGVSLIALLGSSSVAFAQATIDGDSTVTVPGTESSPWNVGGDLTVGDVGTGTLLVENGGIVSNIYGYIGKNSGSTGSVTVSGAGSQWNNSDNLYVGVSGTGTLLVENGGIVSSRNGIIGSVSGSTCSVTVRGAGSQWNNSGTLYVGGFGTGTLLVENSGIVSSRDGIIGSESGSTGSVTVRGAGSQWNNSGGLSVGIFGTGTLLVENGGIVSSDSGSIGYHNGSTGSVTVSGAGSQWNNSGNLTVGNSGTGTLLVENGGMVQAAVVEMGSSAGSSGILAIRGLAGSAPSAPGTIATSAIVFGAGNGHIVLNHTSSSYVFDATINGGLDNAAGSGTGLVGNGVIEVVAGRTILNAYHGDFTGTLVIRDGGILQINHDMTHVTTRVLPSGILEGRGVVSNLVNSGILAPGGSIGTLTVSGNYTGNGGALHIEAVLGDDNSPADRLVISGDVFGTTPVIVTNLGGEGADTINGIRIIEVGGDSPNNAFTLRGDYVTPEGQQVVVGGAYAYSLRHNSEADPNDGNWYLTSEMTLIDPDTGLPILDPETGLPEEGPRYQAGVPLYEQYPQVLASLNTVPTLQQRVGNTYWSQNGAVATVAGNTPGTYGAWGRIEGTRTASDPARSTSHAHRDTDLWKLQTGFDFGLHQSADGALIGGVNISYGKALAEIASPYGRGKIDATGTGIGATLTWYGTGGFYVDGQAQVTWFDSDITSTTEGRKDVRGNNGHGYVLSAETGNRYQLGNGFFLTPQVQLVYSRVDFDSFTDPFGARVSLNDGDSLRGRFGVSLDHEASWVAQDGTKSRSHVYGIANLYNELLDGTRVSVDSVRFATKDERLWAGIGIGGTYEWANGAYAFFGNANIAGSVEHMSDSYAFGGTLGFRARW